MLLLVLIACADASAETTPDVTCQLMSSMQGEKWRKAWFEERLAEGRTEFAVMDNSARVVSAL